MPTDTRPNVTPQFVVGVCLVLFGVLLTLDRMQLVDADVSLRFWPVVIVGLGAWIVVERRASGRAFPGYAMMAVGGLLLLNNLGLARVRLWELFWPLIIVLVGARLIMQAPGSRRDWHRFRPFQDGGPTPVATGGTGTISMFSLLGGSQRCEQRQSVPRRRYDVDYRRHAARSAPGRPSNRASRRSSISSRCSAATKSGCRRDGRWCRKSFRFLAVWKTSASRRLTRAARLPNGTTPRLVLRGAVVLGGLIIKS